MNWNPQIALAVFIGLTATVEDLVRREIPNWIPAAALTGGIAASVWMSGSSGLGASLLGAVVGFLVFLIFYALGGMGGGDVKLMAGLGAVLGASRILEAALWTAVIGGVMAVFVIAFAALRSKRGAEVVPGQDGKSRLHIPYAPAITLGAWIALVPRG
jgi:prepilin peptidase CpaA